MPPGMILSRMWRERRLLSVLLLAVCLVTGFFSLGPLYVRAVSEAGVRYAVENTAPHLLDVTLSNREPLGTDVWELLDQQLSGIVTGLTRVSRSSSVVNGYHYALGEPMTRFSPGTPNDYLVVSFSNMEELFTLVEGRWPVRLAPPVSNFVSGMADEELSENQLGVYSRGEVEAVISTTAAEEARIEVGNRFIVGAEPTGPTAIVRVVGLVEPALPLEDPFWEGQRIVVEGQIVPISLIEERFDFGVIVPEGAFEDWIAPATEGNTYIWKLTTNLEVVHADTLDELERRLTTMQNTLRSRYPDMLVISGMFDLISDFRSDLADTQGPIVLLSGAVLVLMLYHLVTTVALVLEQQGNEWASITSRGGSLAQLLGMQLSTMAVLGVIGALVGPFIAQGILLLLERVGPLARTLDGASLGVRALPVSAFQLSGVAAVAAVIVLTLPAVPAARRSLLRLKQLTSRPPVRPAWARYFLDFVLLLVGFGFMMRLYFMISGDIGASLDVLLKDPASLIRLIASGASDTGGLSDPFNLLGPALVLTGTALLWLRIFPLLMRLFGKLFSGDNGLTTPLALWSVERDPGHYAQLVLLLIGTLALGTASLALEATRDVGSWAIAQQETGGYARVELDPGVIDAQPDWMALPDVTAGESLMVARTQQRAGQPTTLLYGVDPATFAEAFPQFGEVLAPLRGLSTPRLPGLALPAGAVSLTIQIHAEPGAEEPTQTSMTVLLSDSLGIPAEVPLTTDDMMAGGRFVAYQAALPAHGHQPWRLTGFRLTSKRAELQDFSHTIYLDDLAAVGPDGTVTVLDGFEAGSQGVWVQAGHFQFQQDVMLAAAASVAASGEGSLQVEYRIRRMGGGSLEPVLAVNEVSAQTVPLVVSRAFAAYYGGRSSLRRDFVIGDEDLLDVDLTTNSVQFRYRVVGIIDEFPTVGARDLFALGWTDQLQLALNATAAINGFHDYNQAWLELGDRKPGAEFRTTIAQIPGVEGVEYAWDRFNEIQRDPLPNAITGMLFAGFWVSLTLSVLDFAFYLAVTARRRSVSFAVLQAIGWESGNVWGLLTMEQAALIVPALVVGVGLGAALAYLLLPFLALIGSQALRFPVVNVLGLLAVLVVAFAVLLGATAIFLRRQSVNQVLRLGEE